MRDKSERIMIYAAPVCDKTRSYDFEKVFNLEPDENGNIPFRIVNMYSKDKNYIHRHQDIQQFFVPLKYSQFIGSNYKNYNHSFVYGLLVDSSVLEIKMSDPKKWKNELFSEQEIDALHHLHAQMYQIDMKIFEIPAKSIKIIGLYCKNFNTKQETIYLNSSKEQTGVKVSDDDVNIPIYDTDHFLNEIRPIWDQNRDLVEFDHLEKIVCTFKIKTKSEKAFHGKLSMFTKKEIGTDTTFHFTKNTPK